MRSNKQFFDCSIDQTNNSHLIKINIQKKFVNSMFNAAVDVHKHAALTVGFSHGGTPAGYIEANFKVPILEHLQEFFFIHCVQPTLLKVLSSNGIVVPGRLRLTSINLKIDDDAEYVFEIPKIKITKKKNWKEINFNTPMRKNYKDLDRQVEHFVTEECQKKELHLSDSINANDWVCSSIFLVGQDKSELIENYTDTIWVLIGEDESDSDIQELLVNKKLNDKFHTQNVKLQEYFAPDTSTEYGFHLTINNHLPHAFFDFDQFKKHFGLKSQKDIESKLIEVFSYRNNLSQRRETAELALSQLSKNYYVELPKDIVAQRVNELLKKISLNPDYHVYKSQNDFKEKVVQLAEKQLKEGIIIDTICWEEGIKVNDQEVANYLNFYKRARMKDFVYFQLPFETNDLAKSPINNEIIKEQVLREKTLNHIINFLKNRQA